MTLPKEHNNFLVTVSSEMKVCELPEKEFLKKFMNKTWHLTKLYVHTHTHIVELNTMKWT